MTDPPDPTSRRQITVEIEPGTEGHPSLFVLAFGTESAVLQPTRTWFQIDHFKWGTRGIIEAPQSFAVHPDGAVEYNGDTFHPTSPEAALALEERVNLRHVQPPAAARSGSVTSRVQRATRQGTFRVHLDHLAHILVEAFRGNERTETGLRGLSHLAADGWMREPKSLHVDPLQRYVEIEGRRFDNDADGARNLEAFLNEHFVPAPRPTVGNAITVRENPAASTGFDIQFWTIRAGTRFEVKGHLSQEKLDVLQDHDKCDLLQPGILLRISPPFLYIRRRRHDGSEEHLPDIPDIKYRTVSAAELERLLNEPALRNPATLSPEQRSTETPAPTAALVSPLPTPPIEPNAEDVTTPESKERRAEAGKAFHPPPKSPPPRATPPSPVCDPRESTPRPQAVIPEPAAAPPAATPPTVTPFSGMDPHQTHEAAFRELARQLPVPVQDLLLSLPYIFTDRRFEVLDFNGEEIGSVLQLRTDHFHGFYLTHIGPEIVDLVYACHGTHIEWGTYKCGVQPTARAESAEYRGPALLGLAQDAAHHFVFVVTPEYRDWVRPHETACAESFARFVTPAEWARNPEDFALIWPVAER